MGYDLNSLSLTGRLGADPELRFTSSEKSVCNFNIAVSQGEETTWVRVNVWGRAAEACAEHLSKGSRVAVKGRLKVRDYTNKAGQRGRSVEIEADSFGGVVFLDARTSQNRQNRAQDDDVMPF